MYNDFFGFQESPFTVTPDPRIFYSTPLYQRVYANLLSGIYQRQGVVVLTGEAGTGKTTVLRRLMTNLKHSVRFAFCPYSTLSFDDLLNFICDDLELPQKPQGRARQLQALYDFLLTQQQRSQYAAVLIDEAHHLPSSVLAALAELANYTVGDEALLPIALVGQLELGQRLQEPAVAALRARVAVSCRLDRLDNSEVGPFIFHRLRAAGYHRDDLFPPEVIHAIAEYSQGIPRYVNTICDNALLIARVEAKKVVTVAIVEEVAQDLLLSTADSASAEQDSSTYQTIAPASYAQDSSPSQVEAEAMVPVDIPQPSLLPLTPSTTMSPRPVQYERFWQPLARFFVPSQLVTPAAFAIAGVLLAFLFSRFPFPEANEMAARHGPPPETAGVKPMLPPTPPPATTPQPSVPPSPQKQQSVPATTAKRIVRSDAANRQNLKQPSSPPTAPTTPPETSLAKTRPREVTIATAFSSSPLSETETKKKATTPQRDPFAVARPPAASTEARLFPSKDNGSQDVKTQKIQTGKEEKGLTPLMMAVMQGRAGVVQDLLKNGVAVNTQNASGRTALMLAALKGRTDILQTLLKNGAAVDAKNEEGWTALMYAAWNGHAKSVQTLIRNGAKVDAKNAAGGTALTNAVRNGHRDVARLLRSGQAGASIQILSRKSAEVRASRSAAARSLLFSKRSAR
jgi:general secretion pathway protein A